MQAHAHPAKPDAPQHATLTAEEETEADVDNDPGNEDPGSQFDRDATVPLIDPDQ